jgi:hypothetical protein
MAVTYSRYKFMAVSLPKRLWYFRFGSETAGFGSETATRTQKWPKKSVGSPKKLWLEQFFKGITMGVVS